jgi:tRNA pseudouridine38-40 synthase
MRYRLNISYDGTDFHGWQIQPKVITVQGEIEKALLKFYGGRITPIMGSGRTDAGVHAVGQVAHFDAPEEREEKKIVKGLNSLMPDGIQIWRARKVEDDFHSRFQAIERTYAYRVLTDNDIFFKRVGWYVPYNIDVSLANEAAERLLGKHDFRSFATQPDLDESTICDLQKIEWNEIENGWIITIVADRFLRKMVRTLVGTIVEIAGKKMDISVLEALLNNSGQRAGVPAPACGLALQRVKYIIDDEGDRPSFSPWGTSP